MDVSTHEAGRIVTAVTLVVAVGLWIAWSYRPREMASRLMVAPVRSSSAQPGIRVGAPKFVKRLGAGVRRRVNLPSEYPDHQIGLAVMGFVVGVFLSLPIAIATSLAGLAVMRYRRAANLLKSKRSLQRDLPSFMVIVVIGLKSGLSMRQALIQASQRQQGPLGPACDDLADSLESGHELVAALQRWHRQLGPAADAFVAIVIDAHGGGASVTADLIRLSQEVGRTQHFEALARARRLPVQLLIPLVVCILPAFMLVAILPMVMGGAASFDFSSSQFFSP